MTTLKFLLILCVLPFIAGCASLTKTQIESVNTYSCLLEKYSEYPGSIIEEFIQIKYDVEQLNTGTFNDTAVNSKLWTSYYGKKKALKDAEKIDVGIKVIAEYASALVMLSSEDLSNRVDKGSKKLGSNINSLISQYNLKSDKKIPSGIGKLITGVVSLLGSSYVKQQQATDLKKFINEGDSLISMLTDAIKTELTKTVINEWLIALKDDLKNRQVNFLQNIPHSEYKVYLANSYNKEVALLIARIDNLEQLAKKTISSIEKIKKAHKQLLVHIQEKNEIKAVLSETQNLYLSVKDIYINYQKLTTSQSSTK